MCCCSREKHYCDESSTWWLPHFFLVTSRKFVIQVNGNDAKAARDKGGPNTKNKNITSGTRGTKSLVRAQTIIYKPYIPVYIY